MPKSASPRPPAAFRPPPGDRLSPLLTHHHKFSFLYAIKKEKFFTPVTQRRMLFERGIDDTVANPWQGAGYSDPRVHDNSIDVTSAYAGGAFSVTTPCLLLGLELSMEQAPRFVQVDADNTTEAVRRAGGTAVNARDNRGWGPGLFRTALHGAFLRLLPPGNNSSCSPYLGLAQGFVRGRPGARRARVHFGVPIVIPPGLGSPNADDPVQPNRIQIEFTSPVADVGDDKAVGREGLLVVLDLLCVVHFARVVFAPTKRDPTRFLGLTPLDRLKIQEFTTRL